MVRPPGGGTGLLLAKADGPEQVSTISQQFADRVGLFLRVDDFAGTLFRIQVGRRRCAPRTAEQFCGM